MALNAADPFEDIRCPKCSWVHFRELPCPRKILPSVVMELENAWLLAKRSVERRRGRDKV